MQILINNIDALCDHFIEADAQSIYNNLPGNYLLKSGAMVQVSIAKGIANFENSDAQVPDAAPKKVGRQKADKSAK